MMTFTQFVWLDVLVREGGQIARLDLQVEEQIAGNRWPQFQRLIHMGLVLSHGQRSYPYIITERGRIAHALQSLIYARQARAKKRAA